MHFPGIRRGGTLAPVVKTLPCVCLTTLLLTMTSLVTGQALPEFPAEIGAWRVAGSPEKHAGTGLYTYMNGGAELYLEHGFEELLVRFYERGNDQVSVELYRMKGSGYGIFSVLRSENGRAVTIGDAGFRSGYYVIFCSGRYFCAVTAQSDFADAADTAVGIGKVVAALLPPADPDRAKTELLQGKDYLTGTDKVIAGAVSLRNVSDTLSSLFNGFKQGAAARYGKEKDSSALAGFLLWDTPAEAAAAFKQAVQRASKEKDFNARFRGDELSFYDFEGRSGLAVVSGSRVLFAVGGESERGRELIRELMRAQ